MRQWCSRLRGSLTARQDLAEDLRQEMQAHLEMEIQENLSRGMTPDAARQAARQRFENQTHFAIVAARLFGVGPGDPWTIGGAVLAMMTVSAVAGWVPARRASRVDPVVALR